MAVLPRIGRLVYALSSSVDSTDVRVVVVAEYAGM